jgi:uncharacterized protein (TIGR02246 family)
MKIRVLAGMLVIAIAIALAPAAFGQDGPQGLDASWVKAMKAGDVNAVSACYASNAVLWMPGDREAKGAKAIHDLYAGLLSTYTVTDVSLSDTQYETMANVGIAWGHFIMTLTPKAGGAPTIMGGRFSSVAKKIDGTWRYTVDHASAEPPPPAPAAK